MSRVEIVNKDQFNHLGLNLVVSRFTGQYELMIMLREGGTESGNHCYWIQRPIIDEEGLISMIVSDNT